MFEKLGFICFFAAISFAQAPVITSITPPGSTETNKQIDVIFTGMNLRAVPEKSLQVQATSGVTIVGAVPAPMDTLGTALKVTINIPSQTPTIFFTIDNGAGVSPPFPFLTGIVAEGSSTDCSAKSSTSAPTCGTLRWEVDSNAATATNGQTSSQTTPDVLFKLDYLIQPVRAGKVAKNSKRRDPAMVQSFGDRFSAHLNFRTGIAQATVASKIQPVASASTSSPPSTSCPGSSTAQSVSAAGDCTTVVGQQAFLAEGAFTIGWSAGQRGNGGGFLEFGLKGRGAVQQLISKDQILQSGGISYAALSLKNPQSTTGLYEIIGQHDVNTFDRRSGSYSNVDYLLVMEAGYQNNSGLNHLNASSPQTSTRDRFIGRIYAYPEIDHKTHTKILLGLEYNSGLNGGLKDVRYFYGVNADILKLVHPDGEAK